MTEESTFVIRYASASDAELLAELGARTFAETFAVDNKPEDMAAYLNAAFSPTQQAVELADPLTTFFIAEIDGTAVGYAQLQAGPAPDCISGAEPIELARFYVARAWHGRRVSAQLLQACLETARQSGYQTMWLGVWEHNGRARAFYRKWDFRDVGAHIFQLGTDPQTDILMERAV